MALISVTCNGSTWQEDFAPLAKRLRTFFWVVFDGWREREEMTNDAVLLFMRRFSRCWTPGETITLTTNYTTRDVRAGVTFNHRPRSGPSVKARSLPKSVRLIKARIERLDAEVDFRLMLDRLDNDRERQVVTLAVEGNSVWLVHKATRCHPYKVRAILEKALALLNS